MPIRVEIPGPLTYVVGKAEQQGWILNAGQAGWVIASAREENAGTLLTLRVPVVGQEPLELPARVARSAKKQTPVQGLTHALGIHFPDLTVSQAETLASILASHQAKLRLPLDLAYGVLSAENKLLGAVVMDESSRSPLLDFLGEITPFERLAYLKEGPVELLARELILLRVQVGVCKTLLPRVGKETSDLTLKLVPTLRDLLHRLDRAELDTEDAIRKRLDEEDPSIRKGLNELCTRLDEPKVDLYREIEKKIAPLDSADWREMVGEISERLSRVRSARKKSDTDAGYHTPYEGKRTEEKAPTPPTEPEREARGWGWLWWIVPIPVAAFLAWVFWIPHIRLSGYDIPLQGVTATVEDQVLLIRASRGEWQKLTPEEREKSLIGIQAYIGRKKLSGAQVVDEEALELATILLSRGSFGEKTTFTTRIHP